MKPTVPTINAEMEAENVLDIQSICKKVILAPMVRGSELAFRTLVRRYGVCQCYSPMLRAEEVIIAYNIWKEGGDLSLAHEDGILLMTDICRDKEPLTVQLCGSCPNTLYSATQVLMKLQSSEDLLIDGIDLNLGCPQKCAMDGNFGAFLAENNPELAVKCVEAMRKGIDDYTNSCTSDCFVPSLKCVPRLSSKIRLLDNDNETIAFAKKLEKAGCDLLTVHCRQRVDKHNGEPNLNTGRNIVKELSVPVVINGSLVNSLDDVMQTLQTTKAHSVMVARTFLENPCILIQSDADPLFLAAEYLECAELHPPPSVLYIQKHLRWIFRKYLQPAKEELDFSDWRYRLWTFLARPYLQTIDQFRQVVALYAKLSGSELPESLANHKEVSFRSIRHQHLDGNESSLREEVLEESHSETFAYLFQ